VGGKPESAPELPELIAECREDVIGGPFVIGTGTKSPRRHDHRGRVADAVVEDRVIYSSEELMV
jgi:hypothetical protein